MEGENTMNNKSLFKLFSLAVTFFLLLGTGLFLPSALAADPPLAPGGERPVLFFDFASGTDGMFSFQNPCGLFALDDTAGELRLSKPEDTLVGDDVKAAYVLSNFSLAGDFDASVAYRLNTPLTNGQQLEFQMGGSSSLCNVRSNEEWLGGNNYHVYVGGEVQPIPAIATTDLTGTLRITRTGSQVTAYFKTQAASEYTLIHSEVLGRGYVDLAMCLQNQPHSSAALDASFDNLSVQADSIRMNYTSRTEVTELVDMGPYLCVGSYGGITLLDKANGGMTYVNAANSPLPDNMVSAIAVNVNGDFWVGTDSGLARYDGVNWTIYNSLNSGLPGNDITSLAVDGLGNVWAGVFMKGLIKFDGATWDVYDATGSGLPADDVRSIAVDGFGHKWLATNGGGLAEFDGTNWTVYDTGNSGLPGDRVWAVAVDIDGSIWAGTSAGLARFDGANWTICDEGNSPLPSNVVRCIAVDEGGNKWIGTYKGLAMFDGTNWTLFNAASLLGFRWEDVLSTTVDADGIVWVGFYSGLARFDGSNWSAYDTGNSPLPDNYVTSVLISDNGAKWMGTWAGGLVKLEGADWTIYDDRNSAIPRNGAFVHAVDSDGVVWMSPYNLKALVAFDGSNWIVYTSANSGLPDGYVTDVAIDTSGNKWIGVYDYATASGALAKFDGTNWEVFSNSNSGLPNGYISDIVTGADGHLWLGVGGYLWSEAQLVEFDGTDWTVYDSSNSGLPSNYISGIAYDEEGKLWAAASPHWDGSQVTGGGLVTFDGTSWAVYNTGNSELPSNSIYLLTAGRDGAVWMMSGDAVVSFDGTEWTVGPTSDSGLPNRRIESIAVDQNGALWIATWGGLGCINGIIQSPNEPPSSPLNVLPSDGASGVSLSPTLESSTFFDADAGDIHAASQWQITEKAGDDSLLLYDSGTDSLNLTSIIAPPLLNCLTTYYWRVRYQDNRGAWSVWSTETSFTTTETTPPTTPVVTDDGTTTTSTSQLHATWSTTDAESGIADCQYAIGSASGGTDIVGWTSVGTNTQVTKTGLSLVVGTKYYFAVKAKNGVGLWSAVGVSDGMAVVAPADTTPPTTPVVNDDGATTASTSQLHATWSSTDAESGIAEYQYTIGTTAGGTDVVSWTSVGMNTEVARTGLSLSWGTAYFFSVKAKNGSGDWSSMGSSDGITVTDATSPATPVVTDDGATTSDGTKLHATWSASDPESGIAEYQYAIGTTSGGIDVVGWTSTGTTGGVTKTGLTLTGGTKYFISVKAENGAGLWSEVGISNGITVAAEGMAVEDIPPAGGTVQTADGKITAEFPANATVGALTVTIEYIEPPSDTSTTQGFKAGNTYFVIEITDASGNPVVTLSQPITITVKYSQEDVDAAGGDPNNLVLAYYDEAAGEWKTLDTMVNTSDKILSATTTHLSTWAVLAKAAESNGAPFWIWIIVGVGVAAVVAVGLVIWRRMVKKPVATG
jgi:ligand-binding sensor domain-containing protein